MRDEQRNYIRKLYMQIKDAEEQMRDKPMPALTKEDFFLFHETGNRLVYESAYFGRRKYLTVYAILALWSGELAERGIIDNVAMEEDYIRRLEEILVSICGEQFWALPAHVDFEQIDLPETRLTIDLFAAETAQALSEIVLRLYGRLSRETVTCVAQEVIERVLHPFASSEVPYSWWETDRCNWSAVCAGSVGMAAISADALNRKLVTDHMSACVEKDSSVAPDILAYRDYFERLPASWKEDILRRVCDALQCYLDGMEDDGACTEGLGYYNYGMSFYAAFAEVYGEDNSHKQGQTMYGEDGSRGRDHLMYRDKCEQIAMFQQKCYFTGRAGGGISISFSDGSRHESFLPGLTAYLKHCYPQVQTPAYTLARPFDEDACYRYLTNERNIGWLIKYAESDDGDARDRKQDKKEIACDIAKAHTDGQPADALTSYLLPAAQWLICQDEDGNGFAAKGGNNDENHNHNDIGHFLCVYNGEMLLTDLGAGEYTKDYFSDRRYDILCNRSLGHSVPVINGMEQCAGKEYSAESFAWNEEENTLTVELAGAYPKGSIQSLMRCIKMTSSKNLQTPVKMQITVEDIFLANENTNSIAENLVTEYEPVIREDVVWIEGQSGCCRIDIENCKAGNIKIIPCAHSDHAGNPRTVYRITWDVAFKKCGNAGCKMWITFCESGVNR